MSLRRRLSTVSTASMASAAVVGLTLTMGVAPVASAEPCTGAAAAAKPPPTPSGAAAPALPGTDIPPRGHRPAGTNENAPLPRMGQLSRAMLDALSPGQARLEQQARAVPAPAPTPGTANPPSAQTDTPAQAAAPPAPPPAPPGTSLVGWVTGPDSPNQTINRFAITGTDLGIMWDNGDPSNRQVLMAFGDTYGYCSVRGQQWRYNTLFRSQDGALSKTVAVPNATLSNRYSGAPIWPSGMAKQVVNSPKWAATERGIIPTAGVAIGNTQVMNLMSIRSWDSDGRWTTNFSAIAASSDNGENWTVHPGTVRAARADGVPGARFAPGNENFQQGAFLKPGPGDPYLYSFGTPAGRGGAAYISRVAQNQVLDLTKYEYFNAGQNAWVPGNPAAATPVIPGPVSEMSAQYNTYLKQYLVLYGNGPNDIVARTAPAPQGPWGPEQLLVRSADIPGGIYAPYLHPWSVGKELYFNLSLWSAYNVMLMRTVLP